MNDREAFNTHDLNADCMFTISKREAKTMGKARVSMIIRSIVVLSILALFTGCGGGGSGSNSGPVITAQPGNQTVPVNGQAVFTITASGKDLSYQWERSDDSGMTWSRISDATAASYSFTPSTTMTAGFRCTVTNTAGSITSNTGELTAVRVVFVNQNATGGNDGTNWGNAYTTLQAALTNAPVDSEIWVAAGKYIPGTNRTDHFQLIPGVALYGGFTANETCREARDWKANETTLSGEINDPDITWDNCYSVVWGSTGATLDGFTVTGGYSVNPDQFQMRGAGMLNFEASPRVANCIFTGNEAMSGSGMYNDTSTPMVINCVFIRNRTSYRGGGMYNYQASPLVMNCSFFGNHADYGGSGMYNTGNCSPSVISCSFSGNSGDGIYSDSGTPEVINCTFARNLYAIVCTASSGLVLKNSILWGNAPSSGNPQLSYNGSAQNITYNCIEGGFMGEGNIPPAPVFVRNPSPGSDGFWGGADDDYGDLSLQAGSPSIDMGSDAAVPSGITTDLAGNPRMSGSTVDMGAYEYQQ